MTNSSYSELAVNEVNQRDENIISLRKNIENYCKAHHQFGFDPGNPVIRLHEPTFSAPEIIAAIEILLSTKVTMGAKVKNFERLFAQMHYFSHGITSNSGSSANLLAIASLCNPLTKNHLKAGDEVIVPALSWSTTVWPLVQHSLIPVIVDIDPVTLNIDPNEIKKAIGPKTRAIMPVHVYGNPCDMDSILSICKEHDLWLIEDCCEALGASFNGKNVGGFGKAGTFSFYFSHHMTTLEGGITVTEDFELAEMMRVLRAHGWTRELEDKSKYLSQYPDIDPRFLFINQGYNLRITELQAAIGLEQLPKLEQYVNKRRENTANWLDGLEVWSKFFRFQIETPKGYSSCFGFPMIVKDPSKFTVQEICHFLNLNKIETRPIICGNIAAQPAMKLFSHRTVGDMYHSNQVMKNGFSIGNHQAINDEARRYVKSKISEFMKSKKLN